MDGKVGIGDAWQFVQENKEAAVDQLKLFWLLMRDGRVNPLVKLTAIGVLAGGSYLAWKHSDIIPDRERFGKLDNIVAVGVVAGGVITLFDNFCPPEAVKRAREEVERERRERSGATKTVDNTGDGLRFRSKSDG